MSTAFVLSGGAALGATRVGMLLALSEAGIQPDLIVGTSVGAVNGCWIAGRPDRDGIADLAHLWQGLSRHDVFPTRPLLGLLGFAGRRRALGMALHALTQTVNQRLAIDVERYEPTVGLRVVPPLCPIRTSPSDFSGGSDLIDRAHTATGSPPGTPQPSSRPPRTPSPPLTPEGAPRARGSRSRVEVLGPQGPSPSGPAALLGADRARVGPAPRNRRWGTRLLPTSCCTTGCPTSSLPGLMAS